MKFEYNSVFFQTIVRPISLMIWCLLRTLLLRLNLVVGVKVRVYDKMVGFVEFNSFFQAQTLNLFQRVLPR